MISIKEKYTKEVISKMKTDFGYKNSLSVPKIEKITFNVGLGRAITNKEYVAIAENTLSRITGQKSVQTKAKKSISAFKIREGMIIGVKVTIRGSKMYDFLDKLINITFPRVRDFHGIDVKNKHLDSKGNFAYGFKEYTVFPEIKADEVEHVHGLEIAITTTAKTKAECYFLLKYMGFPFIIDKEFEEKLKNSFKK